jgi:hypothetical protein
MIDVLTLKPGHFYHVKYRWRTWCDDLVSFDYYKKGTVKLKILASASGAALDYLILSPDDISKTKEIYLLEFPLYISWITTSAFEELLNG